MVLGHRRFLLRLDHELKNPLTAIQAGLANITGRSNGGPDGGAVGPRTIILVSDGEDTCAPPDPCQVATDVRAEGVELVIHTVGFALPDDASREQLQCIAEAGGGEFHDAADADELATTLEHMSVRESRRYEPTGTVLEGSPITRDAATGELETRYTDTVLGAETNYYRFEIEPGSEVSAEVIVAGNPAYDSLLCPNTYLVDRADNSLSYAPFGGDYAGRVRRR